MKPYADYEYYVKEFGGSLIDEASFSSCAKKATVYIDSCINRKVSESDEELYQKLQDVSCDLAESYFNYSKQESGKVMASETVGPHSVSYAVSAKSEAEMKKELNAKTNMYLAKTGLLYRGVVRIR